MPEDLGQILFLLAFVIIGAIQWIIKQVQERNKPPEEEDPLEDTWRELEEHFDENSYQDAPPPQQPQPQQPRPQQPQPQAEREVRINSLQDLFSVLKGETPPAREPEPVPQPVVQVAPPPVPVVEKPPADPMASLSEAERAALEGLSDGGLNTIGRSGSRNRSGFRKMLQGTGNLRNAFILKEVFDRPLSLRGEPADEFLKS